MIFNLDVNSISGLPAPERELLRELLAIYQQHSARNGEKERYYEGDISLSEVNLGIALPQGMQGLEVGCAWGAKAVDVLAARSMFDGFVATDGSELPELEEIVSNNRLLAEYPKAAKDELKLGCVFATLSADERRRAKIRFHSAHTAAAKWDGEKGRIAGGFAIIDTAPDNSSAATWTPSLVNLYTDEAIWVLKRTGHIWQAEAQTHRMGRPLMEALIWNPTSAKPFGQSRINGPVRRLMQGYIRTMANATIALEFATAPQKYLLGITEDQYEAVTSTKFRQYVGSIIAATSDPNTGEKPSFGQLAQGSVQPHVESLRMLATQFAAVTGLSVMDTGVVNDANPTSSDALAAQTKNLVSLAEQLNAGNGEALKNIGMMALAIERNASLEELTDAEKSIAAKFRNPSLPNISATADAATKIATARPTFADTDAFLEMMGFDAATMRRIKGQEMRSRGLAVLQELEGGA